MATMIALFLTINLIFIGIDNYNHSDNSTNDNTTEVDGSYSE